DAAIDSNGTHRKLTPKHGRGEGVGWHQQAEIGFRLEACAHVRGEIDGDSADVELACAGDVGAGRHAGVIIDRCERPSRLLRSGREAPEEARKPKAHAAFIGLCAIAGEAKDYAAHECNCASCSTMSDASSRAHQTAPTRGIVFTGSVFL